jgi:hypothetical protein
MAQGTDYVADLRNWLSSRQRTPVNSAPQGAPVRAQAQSGDTAGSAQLANAIGTALKQRALSKRQAQAAEQAVQRYDAQQMQQATAIANAGSMGQAQNQAPMPTPQGQQYPPAQAAAMGNLQTGQYAASGGPSAMGPENMPPQAPAFTDQRFPLLSAIANGMATPPPQQYAAPQPPPVQGMGGNIPMGNMPPSR